MVRLYILTFLVGVFYPTTLHAAPGEHLIAFVQTGKSDVDRTFQERLLPELQQIAAKNQVQFSLIDVAEHGAPPEVAITPLIVFQNHLGRSIYQGRSNTLERVSNFIRTSRYIPQGKATNNRSGILIRQLGRARVWAPLKIAPVTGRPPENYNHNEFEAEAKQALSSGFNQFTITEHAALGRADRGFYLDFYPWLSDDGTLFLSLAAFSQFHCKNPVFELKKEPLTGPWSKRNELFRRAAGIMEKAVQDAIISSSSGDGFDPVGSEIPTKSWEELGLALPAPPANKSTSEPLDLELPSSWVLDSSMTTNPPMIHFRFPPPLDNYSGTVTRGRAEIRLAAQKTIDNATGFFEVDPSTITMGEADLDEALQGSVFLHTKKYPAGKFTIGSITGDGQEITFGQITPASVTGTFTLKGQTIPLSPSMELEPILNQDKEIRLQVRGAFEINVRNFNIEEAEGPEPARHTLLINYHFVMKPSE